MANLQLRNPNETDPINEMINEASFTLEKKEGIISTKNYDVVEIDGGYYALMQTPLY